jgi:hypothetical protein
LFDFYPAVNWAATMPLSPLGAMFRGETFEDGKFSPGKLGVEIRHVDFVVGRTRCGGVYDKCGSPPAPIER